MKVFIGQGSFKLLYNGGRLLLEEFGNAGYYLGREWNEYICLAKNVIGSRKLSTLARLYEHCRRNRSWSILGPEEQAKKKKKEQASVYKPWEPKWEYQCCSWEVNGFQGMKLFGILSNTMYTAISYFPVKASLPSALTLFKKDSQLSADGLCFLVWIFFEIPFQLPISEIRVFLEMYSLKSSITRM